MKAVAAGRKYVFVLPKLHEGQETIRRSSARFGVLACGRRWGKTRLGAALCLEKALQGGHSWWVAPTYKVSDIGWRLLESLAANVPQKSVRQTERRIQFANGGVVEVRSAERPDTLRGQGLDLLILDECAFVGDPDVWTHVLRPALADRQGRAFFISSPAGKNWFYDLYLLGESAAEPEWASWRMPTSTNPYIAPSEIAAAQRLLPQRVFEQEFLAEFLEDAGGVFQNVRAVVELGHRDPEEYSSEYTYSMGVDLARMEDYTVISVLRADGRQVYLERLNQISWEVIVGRIAWVHSLYGGKITVDGTGLGDPVMENIRKALKAGDKPSFLRGYQITSKSKKTLIDQLRMRIERKWLCLMDNAVQTNELQNYQYLMPPAGSTNVRMSAPPGQHDDTVIALALAVEGLRVSAPERVEGFW